MIRFTPEMDAALLDAHIQGLTLKEAGEVLGVDDSVISRRKRELDLPALRPWAKQRALPPDSRGGR